MSVTAPPGVLYLGTGPIMGGLPGGDEGVFAVDLDQPDKPARNLGLAGRGSIRRVLVDNEDPSRLYAVTGLHGVWRSDDAGASWTPKNEGLTYKECWSIAQHPGTGVLYVGTGPATIFASRDRAESWTELRSCRMMASVRQWTFPGPPFLAHVKAIDVHPDHPDLVFAAVEEGWLLRSEDGGASWENIKDGTEFDSHTATYMPDDPKVVVSTSGKGVFRSQDGGDTFQPANEGLDRRYMVGMAVHPAAPRRLVTSAAEVPPPFWRRPEGASAAIYRSEDQGQSWQRVTKGLPDFFHPAPRSVAGHPGEPDCFFVGMTDGTIWTSRDGGESFEPLLGGLPPITAITVAAG